MTNEGHDNAIRRASPLGRGSREEFSRRRSGNARRRHRRAPTSTGRAQSEEAIGRIQPRTRSWQAWKKNSSKVIEGTLNGLAADATHLYWSINGESPPNPGNDLYRYRTRHGDTLTDLTPDSTDENGAEVQGVLGASEDGSHVYFAANGDLDGAGQRRRATATPGSGAAEHRSAAAAMSTSGTGERSASWRGSGQRQRSPDALDWTGTPRELFSTAGYTPKTAFVSKDGETLLFRSSEKLTAYDNEGVSELYRYSAADGTLRCVSCPPSGEAAGKGPKLGSVGFPGPLAPPLGSIPSTSRATSPPTATASSSRPRKPWCPRTPTEKRAAPVVVPNVTPACLDVYEWEAPNTGTCTTTAPGYSPLNEGCIYLISTGKSTFPSFFADASESGDDVFFFTRQGLVGQDQDELQDVYDARVGGGLASQNPPAPNPCLSTEACHEGPPAPPAQPSAGSETFVGPGNQAQKHKKPKAAKKAKHHQKKHKQKKKGKGKKQKRANSNGRTGR